VCAEREWRRGCAARRVRYRLRVGELISVCREGVAPRVRRSEGLGGVAVRARAIEGGTW